LGTQVGIERLGKDEEDEEKVDAGADGRGVEYEGRHTCLAEDEGGDVGANCEADIEDAGEAREYTSPEGCFSQYWRLNSTYRIKITSTRARYNRKGNYT
jgi:hypothetical protein